jgi:hypothetical protein
MSTNTATTNTDREELFALAPYIAGLDVDASNDVTPCDAASMSGPDAIPCGECRVCVEALAWLDDGRDEAFALVGLNDAADDEGQVIRATVGGRCPGGCSGGYVADPRGPSRHDPMGLRACPVCG